MEGKILWEQDDVNGRSGRLELVKDSRTTPGYELVLDGIDAEYELRVGLQRAHLAGLWLAILEQADSLEWASEALIQEAAVRSVMKVRACSRGDATKLIKGEAL